MNTYDLLFSEVASRLMGVKIAYRPGIYKDFQKAVLAKTKTVSSDEAYIEVMAEISGIPAYDARAILDSKGYATHRSFINFLKAVADHTDWVLEGRRKIAEGARDILKVTKSKMQEYMQSQYTYLRASGKSSEDDAIKGARDAAFTNYRDYLKKEGFTNTEAEVRAKKTVDEEAKKLWGERFKSNISSIPKRDPRKEFRFRQLYSHYRKQGYKPEEASQMAAYHVYGEKPRRLAKNPTKRIVLGSSEAVFAPGLIRWAITGYRTSRTPDEKHRFVDVLAGGWGLSEDMARQILSGKAPIDIHEERVIAYLDAPEGWSPGGGVPGFGSNPTVKPSAYTVIHGKTHDPLCVIKKIPANKTVSVGGSKMCVVKVDRDVIHVLPRSQAKKWKDNPKNPMEGGDPYYGETDAFNMIRKQFPHLAHMTDEQISAILRQQHPSHTPYQFFPGTPFNYGQMQPFTMTRNYDAFHAENGLHLGKLEFTWVPQVGSRFKWKNEEFAVDKVTENALLVHPIRPYGYAVLGLVKKGTDKVAATLFEVWPTHTRKQAIANRHRMKVHLKNAGYKLRGGYVKVLVVPWQKLSAYLPEMPRK